MIEIQLQACNLHTGPVCSVVAHPLRDREVVGSNPGRAIRKALKMAPSKQPCAIENFQVFFCLFKNSSVVHISIFL